MTDPQLATAETPGMGHNQPPPTPFEIASEQCDLLHLEASNWLDGDPIANEGQATALAKLLSDLREAKGDADAARKAEAKPFDEGKAEVQARYEKMLGKGKKPGQFDTMTDTCKAMLTAWLVKVDAKKRAVAEQARKEADEAAAKAQEAFKKSSVTDLSAREEAERYADDAHALNKHAKHAAKDNAAAKGGPRAVTLRSFFTGSITDLTACARHYWTTDRAALEAMILEMVQRDVRAGKRGIPGVEITEEKRAQ